MLSPSLKLASIGVGVGGVATGAGVGIYHGFIKSKEEEKKDNTENTKVDTPKEEETIAKSFATGTKKLLSKATTDAQWDTNWTTFKGVYSSKHASSGEWKFDNWESLQSQTTAPLDFKQRCETNSNKPKKDNSKLLGEVTKYCTKTSSQ